jgi:ankyrin repeat protein
VKTLLKAGAEPDAADARGDTALRLAKEKKKREVVQVLQSAGARSRADTILRIVRPQ